MDGPGFDNLTRALAGGSSRRRVLKRVLSGAGGGVLALAGITGALGQTCRKAGRLCTKNANCCGPATCDTAMRTCVCPPPYEDCRGDCKINPDDYLDDPDNCGGCGIHCPASVAHAEAVCCDGECGYECVAGYTRCGVGCLSVPTDFVVPAVNPPATDSGFAMQPGDSVVVTVTGLVDLGGGQPPAGPNGQPGYGAICGSILCGTAIVQAPGSPFVVVGAGPAVVTATTAGSLVGWVHDCGGCYGDNTGSFTYHIDCNSPDGCDAIQQPIP